MTSTQKTHKCKKCGTLYDLENLKEIYCDSNILKNATKITPDMCGSACYYCGGAIDPISE